MFRHYGPLTIFANRLIHFPATPFRNNIYHGRVLIKHYGNVELSDRKRRFERYRMQDKKGLTQGYSYEYLLEENPVLKSVDSLTL